MKRSLSTEQNSWNKDWNWAGFGFKEGPEAYDEDEREMPAVLKLQEDIIGGDA